MQYKVPQNVDIEDKVIAGLTLRQFMFIMIAGGLILVLYFVLTGPLSFLFLPCALTIGVIGVSFAFVKINDRPFELFIIAAAKTLITPGIRVWKKDTDSEIPDHIETKQTREAVSQKKSLREVKSSLERLANVIDAGGAAGADHVANRPTNVRPVDYAEPPGLHDVLESAEQGSASVDQYINQATTYVKESQSEPTVGAIATVKTSRDDFKYDKIGLASEAALDKRLEKIEEKEKKLEEQMDASSVEKFDRSK